MPRPAISLLHATYHRAEGPWEVVDAWLSSAAHPNQIEYLLACDDDDVFDESSKWASRVTIIRSTPDALWSTAVRNWNAAARASSGELLVVVADDLRPPRDWDSQLSELIRAVDPAVTPFAVKVTDDPRSSDVLMRHPIISRKFYELFGLFDDQFKGVYCDNDITTRAFWRAFIVDGRRIRLDHRHPSFNTAVESSRSHLKNNRPIEDQYGLHRYKMNWPLWKRAAKPRLMTVDTLSDVRAGGRDSLLKRRRAMAATTAPFSWAKRRLVAVLSTR